MAKITNFTTIAEECAQLIQDSDWTLPILIGEDATIFCMMAIYYNNDLCKGYGQDYVVSTLDLDEDGESKVSVIAFENGVSLIVDSVASRYQDRFPMCGYENLHDDLYQIGICIQAALDRLADRI